MTHDLTCSSEVRYETGPGSPHSDTARPRILLGHSLKRKSSLSWYWEVLRPPSAFSREPYQGERSLFGLFLWSWKPLFHSFWGILFLVTAHISPCCSWDPFYAFCGPCSMVNQLLTTSALLQSLHVFPTGIRIKSILLIRTYKVLLALAPAALISPLLQSSQDKHWASRTFNFMWFPEHTNLSCFHTSAHAALLRSFPST